MERAALGKISYKEIVAKLADFMAANSEEFIADQASFNETISFLEVELGQHASPSASDLRRLISYIDIHFGGQVAILGGLSLGGQVALEMLTQRPDICRFALTESALVKPSKLTAALIALPSV